MGASVGLHWPPRSSWCVATSLLLVSFALLVVDIRAADSCGATNDALLTQVIARTPVSHCSVAWPAYNYILRFQEDRSAQTLSVVLSTPKDQRWHAMGFNQDSDVMPGTRAIIFWEIPTSGVPVANRYSLTAQSISGVNPDTSNVLNFREQPHLNASSDTYYMSFVVDKPATSAIFQHVVFAVSRDGDAPSGTNIASNQAQHENTFPFVINYASGQVTESARTTDNTRKSHGILNIVGWGILLPLGMIVARHGKSFDPAWFYVHAVLQSIGYILITAGFGLGLKIQDRYSGAEDLDKHKALGIVLFILATLQVSAALIRPKKDAKVRRFWNWGHHWLGRSALVLGAVNIFVGIHVASASKKWKIAYGVILAFEIALLIPLEILYWINFRKNKSVDHFPANNRRSDIESSGDARAPPVYDGDSWGMNKN